MPIARNRRSEPDPAKVAAFGAAAESRVEVPTPPPAAPAAAPQRTTDTTPTRRRGEAAGEAPKSSIVRWTGSTGDEELRDRLLAYGRRERYTMQELMIRALRIGLDEIEKP
ncbi:hypothetical protein C5E16_10935 [Clavibacter michiganensis]|uniref:Uncharacterized protein n=1 Tax=Clavibacter michiganensis TaxID=28447 RepID=A0A2S5VS95_9MICO|nr:hypothetical protein [Clavibacter michiganensis]PPF66630.1 hypothetical protein C5E16_10935 [Clavibacter michiganensis]